MFRNMVLISAEIFFYCFMLYLVVCVVTIIGFYYLYRKYQLYSILLWTLVISCYFWFTICNAFGSLSNNLLLWRISYYIRIVSPFLFSIVIDHIGNEKIEPIKMTISGIISAMIVLTSSIDPNWFVIRENEFFQIGSFLLAEYLFGLWSGILLLLCVKKVVQSTPLHMKGWEYRVIIVSMTIFVFSTEIPFFFFPDYNSFIFLLSWVQIDICFLITCFRKPHLITYIPVEVFRLLVIETEGGINLFSYTWEDPKIMVHEDLFSGALQGITLLLKETLMKGSIKELQLEKAIMIIETVSSAHLIGALIVSKSAMIVHNCLKEFLKEFIQEFAEYLKTPNDIAPFARAKTMISKHFSIFTKSKFDISQ